MVAKLCSRSHGQPLPGVRSAAIISMSWAMSRDGVMGQPCRAGATVETRGDGRAQITLSCRALSLSSSPRKRRWPGRDPAIHNNCATGPSVAAALGLAARLEQEPAPLLGLVNEILQEARGRHVLMLVGDLVRLAHAVDLRLVVVHQLQQHVDGGHVALVVVLDALELGDLADRADGRAADLACALRQDVDAGAQLVALRVEL